MTKLMTIEMFKRELTYCILTLGDIEIKKEIYIKSINPLFIIRHVLKQMNMNIESHRGFFESNIKLSAPKQLEQIGNLRAITIEDVDRNEIIKLIHKILDERCSNQVRIFNDTQKFSSIEQVMRQSNISIENGFCHAIETLEKGYAIKILR